MPHAVFAFTSVQIYPYNLSSSIGSIASYAKVSFPGYKLLLLWSFPSVPYIDFFLFSVITDTFEEQMKSLYQFTQTAN